MAQLKKRGVCSKGTWSSLYIYKQVGLQGPPISPVTVNYEVAALLTVQNGFSLQKNISVLLITSYYSSMCNSPPPDAQEVCLYEEGCLLPHVNSGHCELDSFQPQHHKEPLAEGAVPHVLTIMPGLENTKKHSSEKKVSDFKLTITLLSFKHTL